ncbi:uncharacterized protein METZ01_LOCUS128864, partial [marine metagenome]
LPEPPRSRRTGTLSQDGQGQERREGVQEPMLRNLEGSLQAQAV